MRGASDAALVKALSGRSRRAAALELFDRHWEDGWRTAFGISGSRELAEDVAQEAFLRLLHRPDTWDQTRPLRPWLRKVIANLTIDELRRTRRVQPDGLDDVDDRLADDDWLSDVEHDTIAALRRLPLATRLIVLLRYWADLSVAEIADLLAIPPGTVMSRCGRALTRLRKELEPDHV